MPRMRILNAVELEAFESPPLFNSVQRKAYFDFPVALRCLAASLHTPLHLELNGGFRADVPNTRTSQNSFPRSS